MTTTLVLGATGFLGGHIALAALSRGWQVRGLRRRQGSKGILGSSDVAWFEGDLDLPGTFDAAFDGAEIVFHAAAYYPNRSGEVGRQVSAAVSQMRNVLQAARSHRVGRLVYTSSLTTVGGTGGHVDETHYYLPGSIHQSAYYECKFAMESEAYRETVSGLPVVILNPTFVLGPGDVHAVFADVFRLARRGLAAFWLPAMVNVIDVRDAARAHLRAAEVGRLGERYLLGGHNLSLRELVDSVNRIVGKPPARIRLPDAVIDLAVVLSGLIPSLAFAGNHLRAFRRWPAYHSSKAERDLDLAPRPLMDTLQDASDWYQEREREQLGGDMV